MINTPKNGDDVTYMLRHNVSMVISMNIVDPRIIRHFETMACRQTTYSSRKIVVRVTCMMRTHLGYWSQPPIEAFLMAVNNPPFPSDQQLQRWALGYRFRGWWQTVRSDHIQIVPSSSLYLATQARHTLLVAHDYTLLIEQLHLVTIIKLTKCCIKTLAAFDNIVIHISFQFDHCQLHQRFDCYIY